MTDLSLLVDRVEHLLVRHAELKRTADLLQQQVDLLTAERDGLRQRLQAAKARLDAVLERLPADGTGTGPGADGGLA